MGHGVSYDIDSQRVRSFFRELAEIPLVLAFTFPTVTKICVVADHHDDLVVVVQDGTVVCFTCIRTFPGNAGAATSQGPTNTRYLWFVIEWVNTVEDFMFLGQVDNFSVCLLYTSPSPRDKRQSRMPSSA